MLASFHLKVVVSVVGEHGSGASIDSRTSYIGDEIVWGARLTLAIYNHSLGNWLRPRFVHSEVVTPFPNTGGYLASFTQEDIDRYERITTL